MTKIEAGWDQLIAAAKLYFQGESLIAVHGLAASAVQVFDDLSKGTPYEDYNLIGHMMSPFPPEQRARVIREFRKPQNFIKHADRDRDESLTLKASHTEFLLLCGVFLAGTLASECWANSLRKDPPILFAYQIWFCKEYPEVGGLDLDQQHWELLLVLLPKMFPFIPPLSPTCT
ncbi:hypothetical protein [Pseudodesulfovibrio sp.]|uniref:hypothetical protein n=1 Tax=unclassified Pseudodesulfovibrio TaxID=2661612 RepID=UPI003AFFF983